jgi:lysophospholipase L1-like esterase
LKWFFISAGLLVLGGSMALLGIALKEIRSENTQLLLSLKEVPKVTESLEALRFEQKSLNNFTVAELRRTGHLHREIRKRMISAQLGQVSNGYILVMGDSIAEMSVIRETCGLPIINAAIGGSRIEDIIQLMPGFLDQAKPALVVISIGINNAYPLPAVGADVRAEFSHSVDLVVAELAKRQTPTVFAKITPLEKGYNFPGDNNEGVRAFNEILDKAVAAGKVGRASTDDGAFETSTGAVVKGYTSDGIHPTPAALKRWSLRVQEAISKQLCPTASK